MNFKSPPTTGCKQSSSVYDIKESLLLEVRLFLFVLQPYMAEEWKSAKESNVVVCCAHVQRLCSLQRGYLVSTYSVFPGSEAGAPES